MTTANTEPRPGSAAPDAAPDAATAAARAAGQVHAAQQVRHAAGRWLTSDRITVLGQQLTLSIDRYQQVHGQRPTWADALAGVDQALLAPLLAVPDGWPYRPAFWRRELRQHLMTELRHTRWITYTRTPRSLQPGDQAADGSAAHPPPGATTPARRFTPDRWCGRRDEAQFRGYRPVMRPSRASTGRWVGVVGGR